MSNPTVSADGSQYWYVDGRCHRVDGPAIIRADGHQEWRVDGKLHRVDGPAIVHTNGTQSWWVDGKSVNEENFEEAVKLYHCRQVLES